MKTVQLLFAALTMSWVAFGQNPAAPVNLPYYQIPDYPQEYTAGTVAARVVDGLGFRFIGDYVQKGGKSQVHPFWNLLNGPICRRD